MTEQGPRPPRTLGDQERGTIYYAQATTPSREDSTRDPLGAEHPAATLDDAIAWLDQLDKSGHVEQWSSRTEMRTIVARRTDSGQWWTYTPAGGWEPRPDQPGPASEPALVLAPVPEDVALAAAQKGHVMVTAEPEPLSRVERWNCARCARVVLRRDGGPLYGTAITEHCTPNTEEAQA